MPEREMNPQAGNARRFRIDADAGETAIEIILPDQLPKGRGSNQYKIVKKDIPNEAKGKTYGGKTVIWINNHGIRLRGSFKTKKGDTKQDPFIDDVDEEQFTYEVIVPGPPPKGYSTLVYFDGTNVQPANATLQNDGFYHFTLDIGDPPDGWGG
jgi:hypothetical protein